MSRSALTSHRCPSCGLAVQVWEGDHGFLYFEEFAVTESDREAVVNCECDHAPVVAIYDETPLYLSIARLVAGGKTAEASELIQATGLAGGRVVVEACHGSDQDGSCRLRFLDTGEVLGVTPPIRPASFLEPQNRRPFEVTGFRAPQPTTP